MFGIRDGSTWKFKQQDVERAVEDLQNEQAGGSGMYSLNIEEDTDSVLLSEVELGEAGSSMSGTVIGKPGTMAPIDSDIELFDLNDKASAGSSAKSDSDVTLVPDLGVAPGDSGVRLVAAGDMPAPSEPSKDLSNTVELELSDLSLDDSATDLPFDIGDSKLKKTTDSGKPGSSKKGPGSSFSGPGSSGPGSDLTLDSDTFSGEDELGLAGGSDLSLATEGKSKDSPSSGAGSGVDSAIELGGGSEFEDDDLVLGSHTGSDINDSGISLGSPVDSGLSLEEPLELGGEEMLVDEGGSGTTGELAADDEFLLTPAVEMGEEDLDESGSQVIALDTEGDFDDSAATMLGGDMGGGAGILEEDPFAAAPAIDPAAGIGMGAPMMAPAQTVVAREAPFSVLNVISLAACALFLTLTGMFMFDLMRNIWSWQDNAPYTFNSSMMDGILSMFEQ